jgi:predicted nucleotidyltransferase
MAQLPHSLEHIKQVLVAYFADKPVRRIRIFGSYARGEATAESDLDALIDMLHPTGWEYFSYADDLQQQLGIKVDLGSSISDYMLRYIAKDLITIHERSEKQAA